MKREDLIVETADGLSEITHTGDIEVYVKEDADSVMDAMEDRIKELEHKLYGSSGQSTHLLNRINNFRSTDPKATDLIEDCYKCIHQQMATISKMETTQKWISVKDRLPEDGACVLCSNGFGVQSIDIYSKQLGFYDDGEFMWVTHWMPLPPPPTTEEK